MARAAFGIFSIVAGVTVVLHSNLESETFEALVAEGGVFARLAKAQFMTRAEAVPV